MKIKPITSYHDYEVTKVYLQNTKPSNEEERNIIEVYKVLLEQFERRGNINTSDVIIEPLIDNIWDSVCGVSSSEQKGLIERGLKLGEEYGELSAEILKFKGFKNTTDTQTEITQKILLESTDCLIMILDIMKKMDFTKQEICEMADRQINKWISNIKK